jgi:phospholipid/cholesterol/gamma-HCH transport system permease protein
MADILTPKRAKGLPLVTPVATAVVLLLREIGLILLFTARTFRAAVTTKPQWREFFAQTTVVGLQTLPVLIGVGIFVGMNVAIQAYGTFKVFGGENFLPSFSGIASVRELCPSLAAAIIAAKAGTQMAASIGTMKIREQIDALEVMAVDPYGYLVVPRLWAMLLMVPCLVLIADFVSMGSLYIVGVYQLGLDPGTFWVHMLDSIGVLDLVYGMLKGLFFATVIVILSCYFGFKTDKGAKGVGQATNRAIVYCGMVMIVGNMVLTKWMYG